MTLKPDIDLPAFMKAIQQCEKDVLFQTADGDQLNLKSTLSQLVFTSVVFPNLHNFKSEVIFGREDFCKISDYLF